MKIIGEFELHADNIQTLDIRIKVELTVMSYVYVNVFLCPV